MGKIKLSLFVDEKVVYEEKNTIDKNKTKPP